MWPSVMFGVVGNILVVVGLRGGLRAGENGAYGVAFVFVLIAAVGAVVLGVTVVTAIRGLSHGTHKPWWTLCLILGVLPVTAIVGLGFLSRL